MNYMEVAYMVENITKEKIKFNELGVIGNSIEEVTENIKSQIDNRIDDVLAVLEVKAAAGEPEAIVAYNNALKNSKFIKQDTVSAYVTNAEAIERMRQHIAELLE